MVLFTTGRGTPFGTFVPTMKISTNSTLAKNKPGKLNWQYMRLKLDTELREYVEFQCQDKIWDMRGIAADTVDGYGRIDNLINPLFWVGTDTNRRVFFYIDSVVVSQE